jgi:hypothetical protein
MRPLALAVVFLLAAALPAGADLRRPLPGCGGYEHRLGQLAELEEALAPAPRLRRFDFLRGILRRFVERERERLHECLRLDEIQVVGSHNSYHQRPHEPLFTTLANLIPELGIAWDYQHPPLDEQFGELGVRQIELDVFADPEGGRYASRLGPAIIGLPAESGVPELDEPGMKVLHVQDLDFETTCYTLRACLETVVAWSDANPRHLPILILLELKEERVEPDFGFVVPIPFGPDQLDALDDEIRAVVPRHKLVTPDDVRGRRATLDEAVRRDGWPALGRLRGTLLFAMDNGGAKRVLYTDGRPSAEGRVLFPNAVEGAPDAAFIKLNDPLGDFDRIRAAVSAGYLVRTRADADTIQARLGDTTQRDAALASGAQFVSTDYPEPDPRFGTGYEVSFPGDTPARCNPVTAPPGCSAEWLE